MGKKNRKKNKNRGGAATSAKLSAAEQYARLRQVEPIPKEVLALAPERKSSEKRKIKQNFRHFFGKYRKAVAEHNQSGLRKKLFAQYSQLIQEMPLPDPLLFAEIFNEVFPRTNPGVHFCAAMLGNEYRMYLCTVWQRYLDAINEGRAIVAFGAGKSWVEVFAALCGAHVIVLEDSADSFSHGVCIAQDGLMPQDGVKGSLQVFDVKTALMKVDKYDQKVEYEAVNGVSLVPEQRMLSVQAPLLIDFLMQDCQANLSNVAGKMDVLITRYTLELMAHEKLFLTRDIITYLRADLVKALNRFYSAYQEAYNTGQLAIPTHVYGFLTESNVKVLTVNLEYMLRPLGLSLSKALVAASMLPLNLYGVGRLFDVAIKRGAEILIFGDNNSDTAGCTPVVPSPNFLQQLAQLGIDELPIDKPKTEQDQRVLEDKGVSPAIFGFVGHKLKQMLSLRDAFALGSARKEPRYLFAKQSQPQATAHPGAVLRTGSASSGGGGNDTPESGNDAGVSPKPANTGP